MKRRVLLIETQEAREKKLIFALKSKFLIFFTCYQGDTCILLKTHNQWVKYTNTKHSHWTWKEKIAWNSKGLLMIFFWKIGKYTGSPIRNTLQHRKPKQNKHTNKNTSSVKIYMNVKFKNSKLMNFNNEFLCLPVIFKFLELIWDLSNYFSVPGFLEIYDTGSPVIT